MRRTDAAGREQRTILALSLHLIAFQPPLERQRRQERFPLLGRKVVFEAVSAYQLMGRHADDQPEFVVRIKDRGISSSRNEDRERVHFGQNP